MKDETEGRKERRDEMWIKERKETERKKECKREVMGDTAEEMKEKRDEM